MRRQKTCKTFPPRLFPEGDWEVFPSIGEANVCADSKGERTFIRPMIPSWIHSLEALSAYVLLKYGVEPEGNETGAMKR